ncbi:TetR/AcrR family transcriptional regulator [Paenibacillus filicis]|uniref:TetR/AcrR family transcriptional regulator n=1 Tax=Paenibacillus filicis TaxID=669464 RepID=A0ABU9DJ74_9BACL
MSVTIHEVIRSAAKLFKERGFLATSIQDIADDCQIAKGSVYKYYSSKEELFAVVFDQCQNRYFELAEQLKQQTHIPPEEMWVRQIMLRLQYFMEYKRILVDFTDFPIHQDARFQPLRQQVRSRLLRWHQTCLIEAYGTGTEPYVWDLAVMYKALLKEFSFWIIHEEKQLSIEEAARYIVDKMNVLRQHMVASASPPLLHEALLEPDLYGDTGAEARAQVMTRLLEEVKHAIPQIPSGDAHRRELKELVSLLEIELSRSEPRPVLLQAMFAYLEKEKELTSLTVQLRSLVRPYSNS